MSIKKLLLLLQIIKKNKNDSIEAFRNLTGFKTNNFNNFNENELQILQ
jgi:hypothetical protein